MESENALFNVLLWNVYMNRKFYNVLLDAEVFEIPELEERVTGVVLSDSTKFLQIFESEQKIVQQNIEEVVTDQDIKAGLSDYLDSLNKLKGDLN